MINMNFANMPYYGNDCEVDYYVLLHERMSEAVDNNTMTKDLLENLKQISHKLYCQEYFFCFGSDDENELEYLASSNNTTSIIDQNQDIILKLLLDFSPTKNLFDELNNDYFRSICNFKEQYKSKPTYYREYMPLFLYLLNFDLFHLTNQLLTYLKINNTINDNSHLTTLITNIKHAYFKSFNNMMNKISNQTNTQENKPKFTKCIIEPDSLDTSDANNDHSKKRVYISPANL